MNRVDQKHFDEAVKKTVFGIVPALTEFFDSWMYVREVKESPQPPYPQGRRPLPFPGGWYFLSAEVPTIDNWMAPCAQGGALAVSPSWETLKAARAGCCNGQIGAFKIIEWKKHGHALVLAVDTVHIANPWLGFIKLDAIPSISVANTRIYPDFLQKETA